MAFLKEFLLRLNSDLMIAASVLSLKGRKPSASFNLHKINSASSSIWVLISFLMERFILPSVRTSVTKAWTLSPTFSWVLYSLVGIKPLYSSSIATKAPNLGLIDIINASTVSPFLYEESVLSKSYTLVWD